MKWLAPVHDILALSCSQGVSQSIVALLLDLHTIKSLKTFFAPRNLGVSLWSARRILESNNDSSFAFPLYCNDKKCNSNSASAALNKWLRNRLGEGNVIHGFRHSMRDRLRAVECPSDLIDQIGGWTRGSIGEGYGKGYSLDIKYRWIEKLEC